jgi:hypothetical protein
MVILPKEVTMFKLGLTLFKLPFTLPLIFILFGKVIVDNNSFDKKPLIILLCT